MSLIIKAHAEGWVTINGVHVYISDKGKITKGPAKFVGSSVDDLKGQKMSADKKAELQKKYGKKTSEKPSERKSKDDSKESSSESKLSSEEKHRINEGLKKYKDAKEKGVTRGKNPSSEPKKEEPKTKEESSKTGSKSTADRKAELQKKYGDKLAEKKASEGKSKKDEPPRKDDDGGYKKAKEVASKASDEELRKIYKDNIDKVTVDENGKFTSREAQESFAKVLSADSEARKRGIDIKKDSISTPSKSNTAKTKAETKTPVTKKEGVDTFKVDGVEYQFKINSNGEGVITKDNGTTLVGFNSSFKSVNDAINSVKTTNERVARSNAAEQIAAKTGGVALYTGKVIMPGSVKQAGVDKDGYVQYTAKDHTGKTIKLDSSDMGAVMVAGIDMRNAKAMNNLSKNISKSSSPASSNTGNATFDRVVAESHGDNFGGGAPSKSAGKPKTMAEYYRSQKKGFTTGNLSRGKSTTTQNSAKSSNPATVSKGNPSLGVTHYDGFGKGSRNEYKAIYPDGTSKRISAKQAKQMFPDDPFFKKK